MKKMKIAFMIPTFYPVVGGAQTNCLELAKELAKKHDVSVYCCGDIDGDDIEEEVYKNIKIYRHAEGYKLSYYFNSYPSIKRILIEEFDVVHVHGLGFIQQDKIIRKIHKKYPNTKLVCTPHGPFMALKYGFLGKAVKTIYTPSVRKTVKCFDRIIQVNPFQFQWMQDEYHIPQKIVRLIPNGVPNKLFKNVVLTKLRAVDKKYDLRGKLVFTYIGRIQKYKGLDQVIKVLPKLDKDIVFVMIGKDAGDTERLKSLAKSLGVKDKVRFTGFITNIEKKALLELSSIFIFPSEWEAFGIGTLEAMAKGNAIVSTGTEGGRYLIGPENGYLFTHGNLVELEESINNIIDNKLYSIIITNIIKAKEFTWEEIAKQLDKLYREIQK